MIVFSDLHLKEETAYSIFMDVLPGILDAACRDKDRAIAFLGDWWHTRYRVNIRLQNRTADWLKECAEAKVRLIILPGNHDQINEAGENALEVFHTGKNVQVRTEPTWDRFGYWIPYRKNPEDIKTALSRPDGTWIVEGENKKILWTHNAVKGALMNNTIQDTDGLPPELFEDWQVFSGHYHKMQKIGHVVYIGSPYQTTAAESGQSKGFCVWDQETQKLAFNSRIWGKRYHNLIVSPDSPLEFDSTLRQDDEIRISSRGVDAEELGAAARSQGFTNVVVTPQVENNPDRLGVTGPTTLGGYAVKYVDRFHGDLDQKILLQTYQVIVDEAL